MNAFVTRIPDEPTSEGMRNALRRARQLADLRWTPIRPFPAIVSEEVWDCVQAILKKRTQHRTTNNSGKETYLLTGKIVCGECGASYTGVRRFSGAEQAEIRLLPMLQPQAHCLVDLP